ncbi:hypothetical protein TREMEDRAFT_66293 [Tremella mesenterica DSM 1558]|uniref:uncharacterized protein n=1 Tax=Tremella mesenterica (strain ATCC 24925 / CBS 8224 / DSM 1558 / NBRC 9311 / NRRL Y-6157 / RJB 2259-6 / UBC 559-6) TaxID=578456 RepID=UPI00032C9766|nr:uncharacterized protein TREMEDRAFT_66293 [Tremella mesenterica DSM 1558]EIW65695.1 hypothetical protein TREMEDRAFT_66293 [Tremella mesenterica DSM 1558]
MSIESAEHIRRLAEALRKEVAEGGTVEVDPGLDSSLVQIATVIGKTLALIRSNRLKQNERLIAEQKAVIGRKEESQETRLMNEKAKSTELSAQLEEMTAQLEEMTKIPHPTPPFVMFQHVTRARWRLSFLPVWVFPTPSSSCLFSPLPSDLGPCDLQDSRR